MKRLPEGMILKRKLITNGKTKLLIRIILMFLLFAGCMNPQTCYAKNKTYSEKEIKTIYTKEERKKAKQIVNKIIKPNMSPEEKCWVMYKWFGENVFYPDDFETNEKRSNYMAKGPLLKGKGVCSGQAMAYNLMCYYAGVDCYYVTSPKENHAYTVVRIKGKWYIVDTVAATMITNRNGFRKRTTDGILDEYYYDLNGSFLCMNGPRNDENANYIYDDTVYIPHKKVKMKKKNKKQKKNSLKCKRVPRCKENYNGVYDIVFSSAKTITDFPALIHDLRSLNLRTDVEEYVSYRIPAEWSNEPFLESHRSYVEELNDRKEISYLGFAIDCFVQKLGYQCRTRG